MMDPNALWQMMLENLRILNDDPQNRYERENAISNLRDLVDWLQSGGFPPTITEETMENSLVLAPAPTEEDCVCVGEEDYMPRAREECRRFIALLRKKFGLEPEGACLAITSFMHDFGDYLEVVCYFDENLPESVAYALHCEDNLPATWDDESCTPLS